MREAGGRSGRADLHVHTTASDGSFSPAEAVDAAASLGLAALAVADHDTVGGVGPALQRAAELGPGAPEVIPAVEINTDFDEGEIHILGYFIDWENEEFVRTLERLRAGRLNRATRILHKLESLGVPVSLERIISLREEGSVGRPHVARAMVEAGHVRTIREAFERYLSRGRPAYVARERFTPVEAVRTIGRAGGVPVLAHPGGDATPALIRELIATGLEGIEVFHPEHDRREELYYAALVREHDLVATGGSDSHGSNSPYGADIGAVTVDYGVVKELRRRKEGRRATRGAV